ncbi:MAG: RNHCP domain-containing protein [Pontiellaceae bacterium]|nr:RNHCP domain-containing protein [Pontiellaceae bacterium]MBN2785541.1 RNHCP domain-containing protein [Pontiellaceae bacterium]
MTKKSNSARLTHGIDTPFTCCNCGQPIPSGMSGSLHRNHCPHCLWSRHVDVQIGDRASDCKAPMEPIGVSIQRNGEWSIVHRCSGCGTLRVNRIASDDNEMFLLSLAVRPLSAPPFPLERMEKRFLQ